jgi:hypothetical protein
LRVAVLLDAWYVVSAGMGWRCTKLHQWSFKCGWDVHRFRGWILVTWTSKAVQRMVCMSCTTIPSCKYLLSAFSNTLQVKYRLQLQLLGVVTKESKVTYLNQLVSRSAPIDVHSSLYVIVRHSTSYNSVCTYLLAGGWRPLPYAAWQITDCAKPCAL